MQYDRGEQRNLDDDDGEREHERTVRLAKPFGESLGVAHHAEGASHHRAEQPDKQKNGEGIVVEVGEERLLENIGEDELPIPAMAGPRVAMPARRSRACSSR